MRSVHQSPEFHDVPSLQRGDAPQDAFVFGDDMAAAAEGHFGKRGFMRGELGQRDVAERANARQEGGQQSDAALAVRSAQVVLAGGQFVMHRRIADDQTHGRGDRDQSIGQTAAVQQQRVPGGAETGNELIHDAAMHADEFVLGALAGLRQLYAVDSDAGDVE